MTLFAKMDTATFYGEYHGHTVSDITRLRNGLLALNPQRNFVYLAGDSSLDNKYWLMNDDYQEAVNGYEKVLQPPNMLPDISYHLNTLLVGSNYYAINTAIEESTIASREKGLLPQDQFIRNHITHNDILIVSLGGNDIALSPSAATIFNAAKMVYLNSLGMIKKGPESAWGMSHFIEMFKDDVQKYILQLIGNVRPKKIIVCMIYYPDQTMTGSWADRTLGLLGYNDDPTKLQEAIKQIFLRATCNINIPGSEVIPFPMYQVLNGTDTNDYIARVEPSNKGGMKLAQAFTKIIMS